MTGVITDSTVTSEWWAKTAQTTEKALLTSGAIVVSGASTEAGMPLRPCLDCGRLTARAGSRCPTCASAWHQRRDAARGSRHERGYDSGHDAQRDALLPAAYGQLCPRCGELMLHGQALDLDHSTPLRTDRTSRGDRMCHASCNRGASD